MSILEHACRSPRHGESHLTVPRPCPKKFPRSRPEKPCILRESQPPLVAKVELSIILKGLVSFPRSRTVVSAVSDTSPLVRQWILLRTLGARRYGATVKQLAGELGVSVKTIRRDLDAFQSAGFPLQETVGDYGRKTWHLQSARSAPELSFTWDEAAAIYLGRHLLEPLAGTVFWQAAQEGFKKIRAVLGPRPLAYLDKFAAIFCQTRLGTHDYSQKSHLIDTLLSAIEDCRTVALTYQSLAATEPVTYPVHPYGLAYHRGSLYLVGRTRRRSGVSHWKVDRIEAVEPCDQKFKRPANFDLQQHLSRSFGVFHGDDNVTVKLHFLPTVARYVEESIWHPSQKLARQRDGSLLAEFQLDGTEEIQRWILSFGKHVEVLEPRQLRDALVAEWHSALAAHSTLSAPATKASVAPSRN